MPTKLYTGRQPDLALVVITRDEARCIERCLRSAAPHVRRMVVLDTGSTDDTVAIARGCGAQVHQTQWTGNFSAARNAALQQADADWNLILDADEWIARGAQCLRLGNSETPFLGMVQVRSDFDIGGQREQGNTWLPRLLPRGVRYEGRIHEAPVAAVPRRRLPLVLGHDGYLASQLARKAGRNRELLQQEIQLHPDDPYLLYQLGKDHEVAGEFAPACEFYLRARPLMDPHAAYRRDASVRLLYCLSKAGRLEEAIGLSADMMDECDGYPDYFFVLGNLMLDAAVQQPQQALAEWLPMAQAAWQRCLEIGERPEFDGVPGRGSFLAAHNLAVVHEGLDEQAQALHYRNLARQLRQRAD
ncbi:glycosyltransferase family 2 protein [uncultured Azohydromonas sp.]|jgi:Glycosyltransferases involved in cell wall biogenesis|uniref:tetratricopeptide repeat-containing glycosyltransferase family 2 protein n=1 Tax=uncultured Azohydromonas sp. TaxID=487342 RepID=UPI00261677C2|nr:glycosyltransferase family 2 protein [uncultured Azohydromonas sp.]